MRTNLQNILRHRTPTDRLQQLGRRERIIIAVCGRQCIDSSSYGGITYHQTGHSPPLLSQQTADGKGQPVPATIHHLTTV